MLAPVTAAPSVTSTARVASVRVVDELVELTAIFDADVDVVVLRRPLAGPLLDDSLRAVAEPGLHRLVVVTAGRTAGALTAALPGWPALAADLERWTEVLAELTGAGSIGVRLARVDRAMCPRFHVDRVALRLVCTYAGPGTEYLADEHVDRRGLAAPVAHRPGDDRDLVRPGGAIRGAAAGDVVLLKGAAWPGHAARGAVHRSPAATTDAARLVMTLDLL